MLGNDETARRLAPLIRAWPGESGHQRAVAGLDVLAGIGTDVALLHLNAIARKVTFAGLRARAKEKIDQVANDRNLSAEELSDRLVPDLGLAADGSLVLGFGPRRFTVGFDEQLKPYVSDPDGKRRKDLPKPRADDDAETAEAARRRFAALKKDARTIAADQIRRLEHAMVARRRWTAAEFTGLFVAHPLLWHVVRRLVWATFDGSGTLLAAFRVAEDRTFADADDETFTLPPDATVGLPHPLDLGDALPAWSELFADYEILQPFPQLARTVFRFTDTERRSGKLSRFEGVTVPVGKVLGLVRRGWQRGEPQDAGLEWWITKPLRDGRVVTVDLNPGIIVGAVMEFGEQELGEIAIADSEFGRLRNGTGAAPFATLDPVAVSELIADLTEVVTP